MDRRLQAPVVVVVVMLVVALLSMAVSGCDEADQSTIGSTVAGSPTTSGSTVAQSTTQTTSTTTSMNSGPLGAREHPVSLGSEAQVGHWKAKVANVTLDATELVVNQSEFNEPPALGSRYVMVGIEATRTGGDAAAFWADTYCAFVGSGGGLYEAAFGDLPEAMVETADVEPGRSVSGNVIFAVPSDQVAGGMVVLRDAFESESGDVFFAVD